MDEQIRIWRENGLRFLLRTQHVAFRPVDILKSEAALTPPHRSTPDNIVSGFPYPEPLLFYKHRLHSSVSAIITYADLDHDFRGQANDARLRLIHAIIDKATPWSMKDVAFWPPAVYAPITLPGEVTEASLFRIIADCRPKFILDFGGCVEALFAKQRHSALSDTAISQLAKHVSLPSLNDMLPDNKVVKKAAWDILRGLNI